MFKVNPLEKEAIKELFKDPVFKRNYLFVLNTNNEDVSNQKEICVMTEQEKQILKDLFETEPQIKRTYQYAVNNKDAEMLKHIEKFVKRVTRSKVA